MKTAAERGEFGAWAFDARARLDPLTIEQVAERLSYHPASLRKVEAGAEPSRRIRRELPALYARMAHERGVALDMPPGVLDPDVAAAVAPADMTGLIQALDRQTAAIETLMARLADPTETAAIVARTVLATLQSAGVLAKSQEQSGSDALPQGQG